MAHGIMIYTSIVLIWLYLRNKTGYSGFKRGVEFLLSNEKSLSFDGHAYALIALSLDSGDWKENRPGVNITTFNEKGSVEYLAYYCNTLNYWSLPMEEIMTGFLTLLRARISFLLNR